MAPRVGHIFKPLMQRFWEKVSPEPNTGCWLWIGATNGCGYGRLAIGRSDRVYAHRLSYERHVGVIPAGMQIDHLCRNPLCVNPRHLEPVSNRENTRRGGVSALREPRLFCSRGHAFADHEYIDTKGYRQCRKCQSIRQAAYHRRRNNGVH